MEKITNDDLLEFAQHCYRVMLQRSHQFGSGSNHRYFTCLLDNKEIWVFRYMLFDLNKVIEKYKNQIKQIIIFSKDAEENFFLWNHENKPYNYVPFPSINLAELPVNWRESVEFKKEYFPLGLISSRR